MLSNKSGKAKKPSAKRVHRAAAPSRALSVFRPTQDGGLPTKLRVKLRYAYTAVLSYSASPSIQQFRLNSLFDPDYTNVGTQPPYRDQLAGWFNKYRVIGAKWRVRACYGSGTVQAIVVGTSKDSTLPADLQAALCQPGVKSELLPVYGDQVQIQGYTKMCDVFGVDKAETLTDTDYASTMSTSPANTAFLNIWTQQVSGTTASTAGLMVDLTFYAELFDPIIQSMG